MLVAEITVLFAVAVAVAAAVLLAGGGPDGTPVEPVNPVNAFTGTSAGLGLFFDPARAFIGAWAVDAFQWLLLTGSFACGMAFHQCASRYLYAIGREGFLHPALGRTHPAHGSPCIASYVQSAVATSWSRPSG